MLMHIHVSILAWVWVWLKNVAQTISNDSISLYIYLINNILSIFFIPTKAPKILYIIMITIIRHVHVRTCDRWSPTKDTKDFRRCGLCQEQVALPLPEMSSRVGISDQVKVPGMACILVNTVDCCYAPQDRVVIQR